MKKTIVLLMISVFLLFSIDFYGQTRPFSKLSIGIGASSYGIRIETSTPINGNILLRGGVSYLPYSHEEKHIIKGEKYREFINHDPELNVNLDFNFLHGHLMADILPRKNGLFHFTAGFLFGNSKIQGYGLLRNPSNGKPTVDDLRENGYIKEKIPLLHINDKLSIQPDEDGGINGNIKLGNTVKPYLGIGVGRTIPKSKFGVKLDLGVVYQGKINGNIPNMVDGTYYDLLEYIDNYDKIEPFTHWYPMINLQICYKIF